MPGPKIIVVQDLDKPRVVGSFWGEVNANIHRALGCVGTITDGAIRDLDEMTNAGLSSVGSLSWTASCNKFKGSKLLQDVCVLGMLTLIL
jgi:regulator of RNase E activity RraA